MASRTPQRARLWRPAPNRSRYVRNTRRFDDGAPFSRCHAWRSLHAADTLRGELRSRRRQTEHLSLNGTLPEAPRQRYRPLPSRLPQRTLFNTYSTTQDASAVFVLYGNSEEACIV